jgi:hypothetical protein
MNNLNIVLLKRNHVPCELTSSIVAARGALPPERNSISFFRLLLHWPPYASGIGSRLSTSDAG